MQARRRRRGNLARIAPRPEELTRGWRLGLPGNRSQRSGDDQGCTTYSRPSLKVVLLGAAKPGSRPHHWQSTTVPGTRNAASGCPPQLPEAKQFMSIENTPVQSFVGGKVPPELTPTVRRIGAFTHRVPPWNGTEAGPLVP